MKSVDEAMAIDRPFKESLQKCPLRAPPAKRAGGYFGTVPLVTEPE